MDDSPPPELGDRSRSELEAVPKGEGVKKFNQFAKNLGMVMEDPSTPVVDNYGGGEGECFAGGEGLAASGGEGENLWGDAHKAQHVVEETRRCHSMSDLEHLEAAIWEIEDRFLEVKEMVDDDVLQLMYDFECVRDALEENQAGIYGDLFEIAQSFLDLSNWPESSTMGVMRACRKIANNLSNKLQVWENDWGLPNFYMKLLFIVSRCSRLAYCIHPLDYKIESKLSRIFPGPPHKPGVAGVSEEPRNLGNFTPRARNAASAGFGIDGAIGRVSSSEYPFGKCQSVDSHNSSASGFGSKEDFAAAAAASHALAGGQKHGVESFDGTDSDSDVSRSRNPLVEGDHGCASPLGALADFFMRQRSQSTLSLPSPEELSKDDLRLSTCNEKLHALVGRLQLLKEQEMDKGNLPKELTKRDSVASNASNPPYTPSPKPGTPPGLGSNLPTPLFPSVASSSSQFFSSAMSDEGSAAGSPNAAPEAEPQAVPPLIDVRGGGSGTPIPGTPVGGAGGSGTPLSGTPPTQSNFTAMMAMRRGRAAQDSPRHRSGSPDVAGANRGRVNSPTRSRNTSPTLRNSSPTKSRTRRGELSSRVTLESPIMVADDTSLASPAQNDRDEKKRLNPLELAGVKSELWNSSIGKQQELNVNLDILQDMTSSCAAADSQRTMEYLMQSLETFSDIGRAMPVSEVLGPYIEKLTALLKEKLSILRESELMQERMLQWHRLESATGPSSPSIHSLKGQDNRSLSPMMNMGSSADVALATGGKDSPVSNASSENTQGGRSKIRSRSFNIGRILSKPRQQRHFDLTNSGEAGAGSPSYGGSSSPSESSPRALSPANSPSLSQDANTPRENVSPMEGIVPAKVSRR
eukprot:CAMPEP_0181299946 /NCGR_PEP_ID=MMETSP1101-20121128/6620_1 /TAXON_ID=46948 /ORGANISM="Rhodomonas abbreviata, Strain Caron Lab Isolate" /LENGTH=861 /DNA_ID=CAMNT_0023405135 /DNA_START=348 /DNA_END=2930 /DNA_ORIENTATION=-